MATSAFGKAFREARNAGDKTFMFNGKKYTTQLASEVEQPSVGGKAKFDAEGRKPRDEYVRSGRKSFNTETEFVPPDMSGYKPRRTPKDLTEVSMPGTRTNYENPDATSETFKSGGKVRSASARADGIATKGKTRGKIVMCGGGMYKK